MKVQHGKILIIEDDKVISFTLQKYFEANQYQVDCAYDGQKGLEKIRDNLPNIIILDVNLPSISGFDVAKKINSSDNFKDIPIIFLSSLIQEMNVKRGFELGAKEYLTKPISIEYLRSKVEKHIQKQAV